MKKPSWSILLTITLVFCAFTLGLFWGRSSGKDTITVNVPESVYVTPAAAVPSTEVTHAPVVYPLDLNQATQEELMTLPGIGSKLALRILQHRWFYGSFRSVDELTLVEGIGQKRLEEIRHLITIGGD